MGRVAWLVGVVWTLCGFLISAEAVCTQVENGIQVVTYNDTFSQYYYCCGEENRQCEQCCSLDLWWLTWFGVGLLLLLASCVGGYFYYRWQRDRTTRKEEEAARLLEGRPLQALTPDSPHNSQTALHSASNHFSPHSPELSHGSGPQYSERVSPF